VNVSRPVLVALLLVAGSCARGGGPRASAPPQGLDASLRAELLQRVAADQAAREEFAAALRSGAAPDSGLVARLSAVDAANSAWLAVVVARRGWPGRTLAGGDGADAAFLLVQHADRDTALQARVLPLLARAHARGEATGQQLALLTDRLAGARGQPQVYGTQADVRGGRVALKPIADSAGVDARRAAVGLPPLREYIRILDSVYTARPRP